MSYTQIYLHCIFATKGRQRFLDPKHDEELQKYITGIVQAPERKCRMLAINNVEDHIHMLIALHPNYSPSKLMQEVKAISSKFINEKWRYSFTFQWQTGYGCFSYAQSEIQAICKYIHKQKEHHKRTSLHDEYIGLLKEYNIQFDEKYLFE